MPFLGRNRTLFRIFGFPIKVNLSWLLLLGLVVWTLAAGVFPRMLEEAGVKETNEVALWVMSAAGAIAFFASLVTHELCHSVVARSTGMRVSGITLFIFGGVSQLEEEPPSAVTEFFMAVVGPLSSVLIGTCFLVAWLLGTQLGWSPYVNVVLQFLFFINFALAIFNSLPAFPLDGGRVVRSIIWGLADNLTFATRIAATLGSFFGILLIVLGIWQVFTGHFLGLWPILVGFFLRNAALSSFQQAVMRRQLEGETIERFMTSQPVTVSPQITLRDFVDGYVFNYHFTHFPVVDSGGRLVGVVHARDPKKVSADQWADTTVGDVMEETTQDIIVHPETDAVEALSLLRGEERKRLIVVEDGRPIGILSLRDLLDFLALKIDLSPRGIEG